MSNLSNLSNIMNKEKIVFVLALVLFAWGLHGVLTQEDKALLLPRGKKLNRETLAFLVPDVRLVESDRLYMDGGKEVFAEPVDMKPLEPLDLGPPPLVKTPLTAPPPLPGPRPRHWVGLRHPVAPATQGGSKTGDASGTSSGSTTGTSARKEKEDEKKKKEPAAVYDALVRKGSDTRLYGRIRNPNPLSLVEMMKDDVENQLVPKKGIRIEFDIYDTETDRRRGTDTFDADDLEFFSLAETHENLYALKRWNLTEGNVQGRIRLARWLSEVGEVQWAAKEYREALRQDPRFKEIYLELGQVLEREHLWEEALACYTLARSHGVEDAQLLYREGKLLRKFLMLPKAADLFRQTLLHDRGDTKARLALGECLADIGRLDEAIPYLKQAWGASAPTGTSLLNALWVDASVALSRALLMTGAVKEAQRCVRAVTDEDKDRAYRKAWRCLGAVLYASGSTEDLKEAVEAWSGEDATSFTRVVRICKGYVLARLGRYAEARTTLESAMQEDPLHAGLAHVGLGFVAECEGKVEAALEHYDNAIVHDPLAPYSYLAIGRIRRRQGDIEAARDRLQKVLDRHPDAVDALVEMATTALTARQPLEAMRYLERAQNLEPDSYDIRSRFGAALLRANREQQAVKVFESVLARRDDDPAALANLAVVLYRRGEVAKAIGHLQTVVESGQGNPSMAELVGYAQRTAAAIEDNARKFLWQDDFNRAEIKKDWLLDRSSGVSLRIVKGKVVFRGQQVASGEKETALLRTVSFGQLVDFNVALEVKPGTKAHVGVEVLVRHGGRGSRNLKGALQFVRTPKGSLAYRIYEDGEYKSWQPLNRPWPSAGPVRLGFERAGKASIKWNLTLEGEVIRRDIEVRALRSWNRDGQIGVFGGAKIGVEWGIEVDDPRMILRIKKK